LPSVEESFKSLLSPCKLLLELDPLSNEGMPRLNTDDFFCADTGVDCEGELESLQGEVLALTRNCEDEESVGEPDVRSVVDAGICIDCEDERRKKGIEEGVRRFWDWRRTSEVGLRGVCCGTDSADIVWLLVLDSAPDRLGSRLGVFAGYRGDLPESAEEWDMIEAMDAIASA